MRAALKEVRRAASTLALLAALAIACACGGGASKDAPQSDAGAQPSSQANVNAAVASDADVARLNADIERLEKATERNPGDEDTRDELARAYVRRGDAERASNQPQDALRDYQRALRLDPDNGEAQKNAYDMQAQLGGGERQDENGAPAPAPITPNVADDDDNSKTPANANEKPTPKKNSDK